MNHQGTQTIETSRLILRPFRASDAIATYDNWASDPRVTEHLTWQPHENVEMTEKILKSWIEQYKDPSFYQWAICLGEDTNSPIGSFSILGINDSIESGEIGYCLAYDYWGQGYMTELLKAVLDYGFDQVGFHRLEAYHKLDNPASGRVMTKVGMTEEGIRRGAGKDNQGNYVDLKAYAILKSDPRLANLA